MNTNIPIVLSILINIDIDAISILSIEARDTILNNSNITKNDKAGISNVYRYSWVTNIAKPNR